MKIFLLILSLLFCGCAAKDVKHYGKELAVSGSNVGGIPALFALGAGGVVIAVGAALDHNVTD